MLGSNHDERRTIISVFNTVERLNKHPSLYPNFLTRLVDHITGKFCTVDKEPLANDEFTTSRDRKTDYKTTVHIECTKHHA